MGILPKSPPPTCPTPPKQPRLRASCDGCFLAKVKCSKARPICSRCLAVGLLCRYSPSSRALGRSHHARGKGQQQTSTKEATGDTKTTTTAASVARNGTTLLTSTLSEESFAWLTPGAGFDSSSSSPGPSSPNPGQHLWFQAIANDQQFNDGRNISWTSPSSVSGAWDESNAATTCLLCYPIPVSVKDVAMIPPCQHHHHHHHMHHKIASPSSPQWLTYHEQSLDWTPLGATVFHDDSLYADCVDTTHLPMTFSYSGTQSGGFDDTGAGTGPFHYS